MAKITVVLLVGSLMLVDTVTADDLPKDAVAVWEIYSGSTRRVQLLPNGTTDSGAMWERNLTRLTIADGGYAISRNGREFSGRR
jgi:hypothetical protein